MNRAGLPPHISPAGISLFTILPAPIIAPSPILTAFTIRVFIPILNEKDILAYDYLPRIKPSVAGIVEMRKNTRSGCDDTTGTNLNKIGKHSIKLHIGSDETLPIDFNPTKFQHSPAK